MYEVSPHGVGLRFDDEGFADVPYVYRPLKAGKVYEQVFLDHVRTSAREGVYLDVGAHLGTHTVWFAKLCPSTQVHAFEPVSRYAEVVRRNIVANDLQGKVTLHNIGLSDVPGEATNYLSPEHQVGFADSDGQGVTETFAVRRLDDVVSGPVAVIKLDVEGMEVKALQGARRILSRYRPTVFAEAHNEQRAADIAAALAPFGYRPTGKVFNATPTYEFAAPAREGVERLRPLWARLPGPAQRAALTTASAARSAGRSAGRSVKARVPRPSAALALYRRMPAPVRSLVRSVYTVLPYSRRVALRRALLNRAQRGA